MSIPSHVGYGLGRLIRKAFDQLSEIWQKMSIQKPSSEELSKQRAIQIYCTRLRELVKQLEPALARLLKNPRDPAAIGRVEVLIQTFAVFLTPEEKQDLQNFQQSDLKLLEAAMEELMLPCDRYLDLPPDKFKQISKTSKRALEQIGGWPASFDLTTLNGTNGLTIPGPVSGAIFGASVALAGDLNADGIHDLVLGADTLGEVYVLFGKRTGWTPSFDLASLNGTNGFSIAGPAAQISFGTSVASAGDLNADGIQDLVVGATGSYPLLSSEFAYVIFGKAGGWSPSFNLATLSGINNGFVIPATSIIDLGISVASAKDFNGDGIQELIVGADQFSSGNGIAYVLFGINASRRTPVSSSSVILTGKTS